MNKLLDAVSWSCPCLKLLPETSGRGAHGLNACLPAALALTALLTAPRRWPHPLTARRACVECAFRVWSTARVVQDAAWGGFEGGVARSPCRERSCWV